MRIKERILISIIFCVMASILVACAGSKKITEPLREIETGESPAFIIKNHFTFYYESAYCADTQQFLITDMPVLRTPPEKAIKIDFHAITTTASEPKTFSETRKPFSVLFPINSSAMDVQEAQKLSHFIDELKHDPAGPVDVIGYTCRLGSLGYNKKLALNRAMTVADTLKKGGIRVGSITGKAGCCYISDTDPARNRRVEIMVSPQVKQKQFENEHPEGGE
ncbi:MAG: OmpA family protein [Desulfosalsimonadaceae bacterium]